MSRSPLGIDPSVENYLNLQAPEHPVLAELREVTAPLPMSQMQIAPSQAAYMSYLVRSLSAKRAIEVGVFTGYSALTTALALPDDGYLLACDISEEWTSIAKRHFDKAGQSSKLDLVLAPATDTLQSRLMAGEARSYDFAFIDADKENYRDYFEACVRLVRRGGLIVLDNMLWGGAVATQTNQSASTRALREVNRRVLSDPRVHASLIPVGDGLLLATVR